MIRFYFFSLLAGSSLFLSNPAFAQIPTEQDCLGAIPICDFTWSTSSSTLGSGNYVDEDGPNTCLVPGEFNSTWFVFTVVQPGDLAFTILPIDLTADYDWALYNLTNASCEDIPTDPSLLASCNSSQYGVTGISSSGVGNSNGPGPTNAFNYLLPVNAGETYSLNISNWSTSNGGYTIDFSASSATIFDTVAPSLQVVTPVGCNATYITFTFSENILCNTIEDADFSLTGPGGPFTLSGVTGASCAAGGTQEKTFTINFSPPLENGSNYLFGLIGASGYVTDLCGNVADSSTFSFIAPGPLATLDSIAQPICSANSGAIYASGNSGLLPYSFSLNGGAFQSSGTFTGLSQGTYIVTIEDSAGCTDTIHVILYPGPGGVTASIISATDLTCPDICNGVIVAAGNNGTPPYTYSWTNNAGTSSTASNLCAGIYQVTITDGAGCFDTASMVIHQPDDLVISVDQLNIPTCNGTPDGSISVSVSGGTPGYTFSWSPAGGSGTTTTNIPGGNYTLTVVDANQCVYDTTVLLPQPLPVTIADPGDTTICLGSEGELFAIVSGGTSPYNVQWDGTVVTNPLLINPASDTSYTAVATDQNGCVSLPVEFPVTVDLVPVVDLGNDTLLCLDDSLRLSAAFEGASYLWQDGSSSDHFSVHQKGVYWVSVFNTCFSAEDTIVVDFTDCSSCVHYPTAFSPDGNQQNDVFRPLITCPVTSYVMRIFNRWGQLVFETSNANVGWNGEYKNEAANVGVYVWYVEYTGLRYTTAFTQKLSGNVTLVR